MSCNYKFNKKVSIIMPVYNAERFIKESIESILKQSHEEWELFLVDDCSIDKSAKIIEMYLSDSRIKYIKLEENSGAAVARNKGIELASGRYIAFLDSDDLWEEKKLEEQLKFMNNNNIGFSFTEYSLINEEGLDMKKKMKVTECVDYEYLLKNTIIGCSTVIIDKKIIGEFKMPLIRTRQDNATWLKILRSGHKAYGINKCLTKYRIVKNSISRNKLKAVKKQWHVYRKVECLSLIKAIKYFVLYIFNASIKRI